MGTNLEHSLDVCPFSNQQLHLVCVCVCFVSCVRVQMTFFLFSLFFCFWSRLFFVCFNYLKTIVTLATTHFKNWLHVWLNRLLPSYTFSLIKIKNKRIKKFLNKETKSQNIEDEIAIVFGLFLLPLWVRFVARPSVHPSIRPPPIHLTLIDGHCAWFHSGLLPPPSPLPFVQPPSRWIVGWCLWFWCFRSTLMAARVLCRAQPINQPHE